MKFGCSNCFFLNTTNLICRSTDISKCFRGSLWFRDNESRLFYQVTFLCSKRLREKQKQGKRRLRINSKAKTRIPPSLHNPKGPRVKKSNGVRKKMSDAAKPTGKQFKKAAKVPAMNGLTIEHEFVAFQLCRIKFFITSEYFLNRSKIDPTKNSFKFHSFTI